MPKPRYNPLENTVLAPCPSCSGAITSFDTGKSTTGNPSLGFVITNIQHHYDGRAFNRILTQFFRCSNCNMGAVAKLHDNGNTASAVLEDFLPRAIQKAPLPRSVPLDISTEFREAELVAAQGAYRSGSAMLRSVLEKVLSKNGYVEVEYPDPVGNKRKSKSLMHRIDAAADDGVITQARRQRAHDNIRVLGNDVLHEDWREVKQEEFDDALQYSQRILEDLYDDRPTVEAILLAKGRAVIPATASTTPAAAAP
jgi:hypothetical protein